MKLCLALTLCAVAAAGRTITYSGNDAKINGQMIWDHGEVAHKFCAEKTGYPGSKYTGWDRCNHCVPGCRVCSGIGAGAKSCTGTIGTCWSFRSITCSLPDETSFTKGDAPLCHVDKQGRTVVHYDSRAHPSFKCSHSGNKCTCTAQHPTHHKGGCKEFDHTDGQTFAAGGDCSKSGLTKPPVDGVWGAAVYSACSKQCGSGVRTATYTCVQPKHGGKPCPARSGSTTQYSTSGHVCNTRPRRTRRECQRSNCCHGPELNHFMNQWGCTCGCGTGRFFVPGTTVTVDLGC